MPESVNTKHGCRIHDRVSYPKSVTGYLTLSRCSCSLCGFNVSTEKDKCPSCGAIMDLPSLESDDIKPY